MNYTYVQELEMNLVYDNENIFGGISYLIFIYRNNNNINMKFGGIAYNDVVTAKLSFWDCTIPKVSVISYKWLENNRKDGFDEFD